MSDRIDSLSNKYRLLLESAIAQVEGVTNGGNPGQLITINLPRAIAGKNTIQAICSTVCPPGKVYATLVDGKWYAYSANSATLIRQDVRRRHSSATKEAVITSCPILYSTQYVRDEGIPFEGTTWYGDLNRGVAYPSPYTSSVNGFSSIEEVNNYKLDNTWRIAFFKYNGGNPHEVNASISFMGGSLDINEGLHFKEEIFTATNSSCANSTLIIEISGGGLLLEGIESRGFEVIAGSWYGGVNSNSSGNRIMKIKKEATAITVNYNLTLTTRAFPPFSYIPSSLKNKISLKVYFPGFPNPFVVPAITADAESPDPTGDENLDSSVTLTGQQTIDLKTLTDNQFIQQYGLTEEYGVSIVVSIGSGTHIYQYNIVDQMLSGTVSISSNAEILDYAFAADYPKETLQLWVSDKGKVTKIEKEYNKAEYLSLFFSSVKNKWLLTAKAGYSYDLDQVLSIYIKSPDTGLYFETPQDVVDTPTDWRSLLTQSYSEEVTINDPCLDDLIHSNYLNYIKKNVFELLYYENIPDGYASLKDALLVQDVTASIAVYKSTEENGSCSFATANAKKYKVRLKKLQIQIIDGDSLRDITAEDGCSVEGWSPFVEGI